MIILIAGFNRLHSVSVFLFRYLTFPLSELINGLKRGNKDEHSLKLKNPIGFFMCTR